MNSNTSTQESNRWERGQAFVEYMMVIAGFIGVTIVAGSIGFGTQLMYGDIVQMVDQPAIVESCESHDPGPTVSEMNGHTIELTSTVYDEASDTTTITYHVTNGNDPSISHWVLGISREVADNIVNSSEAYEWTDSDPTTGASGIKFDTGYESSGGNNDGNNGNGGDREKGNNGVGNGEDPQPPGNPPVNDGEGTGPGNPGNRQGDNGNGGNGNGGNGNGGNGNGGNGNGGNGNGNRNTSVDTSVASIAPTKHVTTMKRFELGTMNFNEDPFAVGSTARDVVILVSGNYDAIEDAVVIKAGREVYYSTISLPAIVTRDASCD